jgi:hypothetical protein
MPHLLQSRSPEAVKARIAASATPVFERIFQTARGGILQDSGYNEVWTEARQKALTPAQQRSPLGRRPYGLRHAAVSLWLNSGVPATEVARRTGHGVAVLLKIYAHCIDGQADAANQRVTDALGTTEPESAPAVKKTTTASRHPEMPGQQPDAEQNGEQVAPPDGQHTAPAPAVRARPWIPCLPASARTDA